MKVWNFKKQDLEDGIDVPVCNGSSGRYYALVNINYNCNGETIIEYLKERKDNEREKNKRL